jgi:hypothetical protein
MLIFFVSKRPFLSKLSFLILCLYFTNWITFKISLRIKNHNLYQVFLLLCIYSYPSSSFIPLSACLFHPGFTFCFNICLSYYFTLWHFLKCIMILGCFLVFFLESWLKGLCLWMRLIEWWLSQQSNWQESSSHAIGDTSVYTSNPFILDWSLFLEEINYSSQLISLAVSLLDTEQPESSSFSH